MDTRKIKKLIELVKETGVGELEVKSGDESVRINCQTQASAPIATSQVIAPQPAANTSHIQDALAANLSESHAEPTKKTPEKHPDGHHVKSPMVGTVYLSSTPGSKPFVAIGDHVNIGDTLCLIEAMKMFNKIEADMSGVISARLIENEQPVEYDQPLFIIEPSE
ncbi:MAG: acetyl-CoA carboxylase biotin carboxyl carrier protein [Gammaproteobacteria bacterium]|nr:acetyl-CoA carboxylase biotin carboxyl carrier protein [Gammaproteobacteria bacterium]MCH9744352.1 acetyl-CoA carboxylase biotin carboxyl carrier protein [Gammaproteobacteria bacterium]